MFSTAQIPSYEATCASMIPPITSPMAHTPPAVVRRCSSTPTRPPSSFTPASAAPRPHLYAHPPTPTNTHPPPPPPPSPPPPHQPRGHLPAADGPGRAAQRAHGAGLEEALDALHELVDHRVLALLGRRPVEADPVGDQGEGLASAGQRIQLGGLQQRLGGDAPADEAGTAHAVLLDDRRGGAELGSAQGRHVAARAAAYDEHIK